MTHLDRSPEVERYFALRDKVARLLKEAGVKKAARGYVAEVLIDAGVIDFGELEAEESDMWERNRIALHEEITDPAKRIWPLPSSRDFTRYEPSDDGL